MFKAQNLDRVQWLMLGHVTILVREGQGGLVCGPAETAEWVKKFPNENHINAAKRKM